MYTLICQTCYGHLNSFIILFTQPRSVQKGFTTNHQWVELMPDRLKIWTWQETSKDRTKYRTNHQFHSCPSCCDWNGNHLMGQGTSPPSPTHRSFPSCPDQTFERPHRWKARLFERAQKWSFNVRHIANGVPKTHVYKCCNIYIYIYNILACMYVCMYVCMYAYISLSAYIYIYIIYIIIYNYIQLYICVNFICNLFPTDLNVKNAQQHTECLLMRGNSGRTLAFHKRNNWIHQR